MLKWSFPRALHSLSYANEKCSGVENAVESEQWPSISNSRGTSITPLISNPYFFKTA